MIFKFPKNFFWGTANSAYQHEGGNFNDFSVWEKRNAKRLAKDAKTRYEPWQQKMFPEMFDPANYICGKTCDQYHLFEKDFDIAKKLHLNAHRFSIEWSRIEPREGKFQKSEIEHYQNVISALKKRGLTPFVSLWHSTLPVWLYDKNGKGGWSDKKTINYFTRYVEKVTTCFSSQVQFWTPINEPEIYAAGLYLSGLFGRRNILLFVKTLHNLLDAQKATYRIIKSHRSNSQIGISKSYSYFRPKGNP